MRVLDFMLTLLADRQQPTAVRLHVLRNTRNGKLTLDERPRVARALLLLLEDPSSALQCKRL